MWSGSQGLPYSTAHCTISKTEKHKRKHIKVQRREKKKKTITKTICFDRAPTCSHARLYRFAVQAGQQGIYTKKVGLTPVGIALSRRTLT